MAQEVIRRFLTIALRDAETFSDGDVGKEVRVLEDPVGSGLYRINSPGKGASIFTDAEGGGAAPGPHAAAHLDGGSDEMLAEGLATASNDTSAALRPDGAGGLVISDVDHVDLTGVTADQHHAEAHTVASHSDTTATGAELETLTDGSNADALHAHAAAGAPAHADTTGQTADDHHDEAHTVASHSDTTATGAELETLTDGSNADALHAHSGGGAMELVEVITVTGSDVQDVTFSGLDGNTDKFYLLVGALIHGDTPNAREFELHPNSVDPTTSETSGYIVDDQVGPVLSGFNVAGLTYCGGCTLARLSFKSFIDAESGKDRTIESEGMLYDDPFSGIQFKYNQGGIWNNDSDNITSLRIHGSAAGTIGVGSKFTLWKQKA